MLFIRSFQIHGAYHAPDPAAVIVDDLILQMINEIEANSMLPVGKHCTFFIIQAYEANLSCRGVWGRQSDGLL